MDFRVSFYVIIMFTIYPSTRFNDARTCARTYFRSVLHNKILKKKKPIRNVNSPFPRQTLPLAYRQNDFSLRSITTYGNHEFVTAVENRFKSIPREGTNRIPYTRCVFVHETRYKINPARTGACGLCNGIVGVLSFNITTIFFNITFLTAIYNGKHIIEVFYIHLLLFHKGVVNIIFFFYHFSFTFPRYQ